jgi:hypothetical protein
MKTKKPYTQTPDSADAIAHHTETQSAEHAAICHALRTQIDAALPKAASKIWHGGPVWFVGENPVVGYSVTAKNGVSLLFWNGLSFGEPVLKPVGKGGRAGQIQFTAADQIDATALRRWLKRAGTDVFDSRGYFLGQRAAAKKAKQ